MKKLKIGLVGCGGIANNKHMPALAKLADKCEMVAFCDILIERAEKAAKEYGTPDAKVYTDYTELLANPDVDVVHVLTPNVAHRPITVAAFEAGKHVMCEKPMAHTSAARTMSWARSTSPRLTPSVAAPSPLGACSPTRPCRAAVPSSTSAPMHWT